MKIIGCQVSQGNYEGRDYHKLRLFCSEPREKVLGVAVDSFAIDYSKADNLLEHCSGSLDDLLGLEVEVFYDKYKKPSKVLILS